MMFCSGGLNQYKLTLTHASMTNLSEQLYAFILQQSVFGGSAWEWDAVRQQYYYHAFLKSQIDFNYHNPDVLTEMDVSD